MEIIDGGIADESPTVAPREMTVRERVWSWLALHIWHRRIKRWLPRLVWLGDEIDVCITFPEDALSPGKNPFAQLFSGGLFEIEKQLRHMGIDFDKGMGAGGRDWEWDWSLKGPVRVKFCGRAQHPERRARQPDYKPDLRIVTQEHGNQN